MAILVADVSAFERWKHLGRATKSINGVPGSSTIVRRSWNYGKKGDRYRNGLDELIELEGDYLYPMLKSSEITKGRE